MKAKLRFLSTVLLLIIFSTQTANCSEQPLPHGVVGFWKTVDEQLDSAFRWEAKWIWTNENNKDEVVFARRTFTLNQASQKHMLRITASDNYKLYLNGKYVARGPARSAAHHQSYDIFDVTSLLRNGKNTLAVQADFEKGKPVYNLEDRAGILVELRGEANKVVVVSDAQWKISNNNAWDKESPRIARFGLAMNDRVSMSKFPADWEQENFDDSSWSQASELARTAGWPAPRKGVRTSAWINPWTYFVPREIPYLIEDDIAAKKLIGVYIKENVMEKGQAKKLPKFSMEKGIDADLTKQVHASIQKEKTILIPPTGKKQTTVLIFDFGKAISAFPQFEIEGTEGTTIDVMCSPYSIDKQFDFGVLESQYLDRIWLSGKKDKWQACAFKPTRFLAVAIRGTESEMKIHSIGLHSIAYPFIKKGVMQSQDAPWVKNYFDATAKTINACTTDAFTDNYRERRQYAQTGYYGALGNYYIFGDYALQRRYLVQVAQEQEYHGLMPSYAPLFNYDYMVILDSNCLWIRSLHNYLLYSGDYKTVKELLPAAKKMMVFLGRYTNKHGMIDDPAYAYWLDHAKNDRQGANLNLNGHYLGALHDFSKLLEWLGDADATQYTKQADKLRASLQKYLWDEKKQLFADAYIHGKLSDQFSEHGNAMALNLNIANEKQREAVAKQLLKKDKHNYIFRESGITMVTPAMSYFLHKGLCESGYTDASLNMFCERFNHMLDEDTNQTLWEEWWLIGSGRSGRLDTSKTRSDAQTESAFAPDLFAKYLMGFQVTKPGFKEVTVKLPQTEIKNIEAEIPSPEGVLSIAWTKNKGKLILDIPGEMVLVLDIASFDKKAKAMKINGKTVNENEKSRKLTKGKYTVDF